MLRFAINTFINVYYVDLLILNILLAAIASVVEILVFDAVWWHVPLQIVPAVSLAVLGRLLQRVPGKPLGRAGLVFKLWLHRAGEDWMRPLAIAVILPLCTIPYDYVIQHPALSANEQFPIGIIWSTAYIVLALHVIECIGLFFDQPSCEFKLFGLHSACAIGCIIIASFDVVVFTRSYYIVPFGLASLAFLFCTGRLFKYLLGVEKVKPQ